MYRILVGTTALVAAFGISHAASAQTTLYVGSFGGSVETLMKERIIPAFEAEHDVRISYVSGNSTENLARLQAQEGAQELDVVLLDDGPMYQAMALGFCGDVAGLSNLGELYDLAKIGDNAVGIGVVATGLAYNTEIFEEEGWEPPSSWRDLADQRFAGRLSVPPISNTYGLHTLVMLAHLEGGGEENIDPGFEYLANEVSPNVLAFEASPGRMSELFQNEEVVLAVWGSGRVVSLQDTGFPIDIAYPEEGAVALMVTGCPVSESENPEIARAFLDYLLEPEVQAEFAATQGYGPVNRNTELEEDVAARVPYGPDEIDNLVAIDWDVANQNRQDWTRRWAREVE